MVEVQFQALNLHAGIDEKTIMMFMNDSLEKAEKGEIWLFFDEINTCNYIGLLADLISHRMLNGKPIHPNIRLFAACNPYRLRTKAQSQAGLTNRAKNFEQSKLVYQVKPLPDQILDYVWDYGILKPEDEHRYIQIMVGKESKTLFHPEFAELLFASQEFIRKVEERYSVSLRDVKRAISLVKFFHNSLQNRPVWREGHTYPPTGKPTIRIRSYVLALSLCYHSRLYEQDLRKQYRQEMGQILHDHNAYVGENMFAKIIREEQEDYINRMQCPPNTAYNEALLENVLVMIVCILTKIPLFLIGAPGSSKSLAVRLISSNLRGPDSSDKYFRNLAQVYLIPHQGSSSSTSEGIIKVFEKANKFQETTSKQFPVASVVLLDEVGLAETSPFNPLKVLHSLLEPNLRKQYRQEMGQILHDHNAYVGENMFAKIIREEQEDYINRMQCPPNTAYNEALLENVLVMIVCILTKIPLFLIGAPGSSKSLAVRLISSNLRGPDSSDKYFRNLAQVYLIPHQGSSSSTSEGIIKVFEKANKFQETTSKQFPVASVVLLDEVGLAETSPFNPLKVLHSLLEPSYPATGPTVSVIGISNWRLDNSKSSRALLVQRPQFNLNDLVDTAERLLNKRAIASGQRGALSPLAKAYSNFEKHGQSSSNFHGLRDYYALVKRLSLNEMTPENIQMALARNFGGTDNHVKLCDQYFGNVLKMFNNHKPWTYKQVPVEQLIDTNLKDPDARHLMVIGKSDSIVNLLTYQLRKRDPVVILGSQFPDDQEDYYYSMCVEAGRPLILTDLEIIYGSLYDLWNQNYIVVGSKDNVKYFTRVALGAYANPMLYVSPNFKCILVMDENKLALADPPLLNRFEKQKMSINDILDNDQKLFYENLNDWARKFSTPIDNNQATQSRNKFTQKDLFIGFDKNETLQSLIIDITKNNPEADEEEILEKCKECLIATATSDGVVRAELSALERDEFEKWKRVYFNQQHHDSLYDYFTDYFDNQETSSDPNGHLLIINTFSNINTDVKSCLQKVNCQVDKLSIFKTEAQLSNRVKHFWSEESNDQMLILQCDVTTVRSNVPTSGLLGGSLSSIVDSTYPFEKILQQELLWCLSCMKYPSNDKSINHIKTLNEKILKYPNFIKCLKVRILEWIKQQPTNDWQYEVASNKQNLYPYPSFSAALQTHIRTLFKKPIAQILSTQSRNKFTQKDLFIGFDKNETLQSLIIDIMKNNPEADEEEILEKCKECLIATATSDGVVRAELSALERDEFEKWKHVYFNQQHHDSLYDYFDNQGTSSVPNGHLLIINTFSNINTDVMFCLRKFSCQVDKLSIFKTEAQLSNRVKHFWSEESNDQMLILQCDITTVSTGCIKLAKLIIEQFRKDFIAKKDQMEHIVPMKHACIILHIHRDQESTFSSFNFMCGWKQITIETLSGSNVPTSGLLDGSLSRIVDSTYPFEKILQQELLWCLSCMKYPSNDKSINHIKTINEKILKCQDFIKCLKVRILEWIKQQPTNDWQYKVASNKQNLYPYPSFSAALQTHIRTLFKKPIAQILCALERLSATKTFFYINERARSKGNYEKLLKFWEQVYMDKKIVKIENTQNPELDGYNMPAGSLLDLEFPFFLYFMNQINSFKRIYEEEIDKLQEDNERIDEETNELYDYVIEDHLKEFKDNILTSIPLLKEKDSPFEWEWASELYFNDFVTIIASKDGETKNKKMLASILKLLIGDKTRKPIFLHAYWWENGNEVLAQLQLAQMSPMIIENIEIQGNVTAGGNFEKHLVKELIKLMLQQIRGNFEGAGNSHSIDKWQHDVTKILSLVSKVTRAKNLPDLQLLRIVNDLVATKSIPLDSIREIVQLGLSSDEQGVLSEKFVSTVLDKLDKLEQNEKNIIPRRSFIMRCLALIPIESEVRLSLYEKLFSKEPFPLMGAIIERIFLKEDRDIFFLVITDFEEALIQSPRLNIINKCLGDLDTNMATLCCDTIEQTFFMNEELENLGAYIGPALEALYRKGIPSLQKITSIALLKEFVRRFWDSFIKKDNNDPDQMEEDDFNNDLDNDFVNNELIGQINNILTFVHPLIDSFKIYFLRDLCRRDFSMDDIRRFCDAQKHLLPWLGSFNWEDIKENRLSFNPYCYLPEYNEAENSIMYFYSIGNKTPFQKFIQNMNQNMTLTAKLSLTGLFF
ncbi:hypothetical protein RhiirA4_482717, partial [Rhizophagus irregularis]